MPTKVPGIAAAHVIIKPECRGLRGDQGALTEALLRLTETGQKMMECWPLDKMRDSDCEFHLVFTVDYRKD